MADAVSDTDTVKPPPKRRRILNLSAVVPVPIYSNQVGRSLQLKPAPATFSKGSTDDAADDSLFSQFSSRPLAAAVTLSDSEEDEDKRVEQRSELVSCPSPPPPVSPVQKQSRQVQRKISEIDRKLRAVNSLLSPEPQDRRTRRRVSHPPPDDDDIIITSSNDDDVIIMSPSGGVEGSPYSSSVREFPLKVRCRTDVHKISVQSSTPLRDVVAQLSVILDVPRPRLLLMREEVELPTDSTVGEHGLGIADIIECVVMAAEGGAVASSITVKLQSKDRDSSHEFSLNRDAPLGSVFSQYLSRVSHSAKRAATFHFDGAKLSANHTPAQLDMEDGDIIEVWI